MVEGRCIMDFYDALLAKQLGGEGGGGGEDTNLSDLDIYVADFVGDPPTIADGSLNGYTRQLVA